MSLDSDNRDLDVRDAIKQHGQMDAYTPRKPGDEPGAFATSVGTWIHNHKELPDKNPLGYVTYQFIRGAFACVPYGVSMATTWFTMEKLGEWGGRLAKDSENVKKLEEVAGFTEHFGYRTRQLMNYGAFRTGVMVATSFTLYRATSKLGKWVKESLFNTDDSKEKTIQEVHDLPHNLWNKINEVKTAEWNSTAVSAMALGFVTANFDLKGVMENARLSLDKGEFYKSIREGKGFKHFTERAFSSKAKFWEQAAINTLGYSLFFELGDRRFKDKQISRGYWHGGAHSIGSGSKANPSLLESPFDEEKAADGVKIKRSPHEDDSLSQLTAEPSALRFFLRRVVPTAVGIGLYTGLKFRGGPMIYGRIDQPLKKVTDIPGASWREGAATSAFCLIPMVSDKYVQWYDNFTLGLEEKISGRPGIYTDKPQKDAKSPETMNHKQNPLSGPAHHVSQPQDKGLVAENHLAASTGV